MSDGPPKPSKPGTFDAAVAIRGVALGDGLAGKALDGPAVAVEQAQRPTLQNRDFRAFEGKASNQLLQELMDREEIRELISRYAHRIAQGVSVADLFCEDGAFIVRFPGRPARQVLGRAALEQLYARPTPPPYPLPMIHNHLLEIDGDEGAGLCSNELRMLEDGKSMIGSGYYQDRFRRENGRWRFALRDMTFIHWVPIQQGWAAAPVPELPG